MHWVTCTLPASPPASMLFARVTSLLHTSYLVRRMTVVDKVIMRKMNKESVR